MSHSGCLTLIERCPQKYPWMVPTYHDGATNITELIFEDATENKDFFFVTSKKRVLRLSSGCRSVVRTLAAQARDPAFNSRQITTGILFINIQT